MRHSKYLFKRDIKKNIIATYVTDMDNFYSIAKRLFFRINLGNKKQSIFDSPSLDKFVRKNI